MFDEGHVATITLFAVALKLMGYKSAAIIDLRLRYWKIVNGEVRMHTLTPKQLRYD